MHDTDPFGAGDWVADFEIREPAPVPVPTIAWLYGTWDRCRAVCATRLLGRTRTMASGWTCPYLTHHPIFTSAPEAVTALRDGWQKSRGDRTGR